MTGDSHNEPERLAETPPRTEQGAEAGLTQSRKILRERAHRLAREPAAEECGERLEVVEFLLGREHYGIETSFIREVHPLRDVTPLPCTPPFVVGIMNLRGEILSIIDIRKLFDLDEQGLSDLNKVIVLGGSSMEFGILADHVIGVRTIMVRGLQPSLTTVTGMRADCLKGVTREHLVLLDAGKMLADRRIVVHEEV
jgi:purine-binding chemotaxis protein CheW